MSYKANKDTMEPEEAGPSVTVKTIEKAAEKNFWEYLLTVRPNDQPMDIPRPPSPTPSEKRKVAHYRRFRRHIHEGPYYTVMDENMRLGKSKTTKKGAIVNPFEDMPTYTSKYKPTKRSLPVFVKGTYDINLFPPELWDVIDPSLRPAKVLKPKPGKRRSLAEVMTPEEGDVDEAAAENDVDAVLNPDDEPVDAEADPDETYEDQDSDMGGDYNAEQYFDDGDGEQEESGGHETGGDDYE